MSNDLQSLAERLEILIRLLSFSLVQGKKPSDQMLLLSRAGLPPKEIAQIVGTTAHTVSVTLSKLKTAQTSRKRGMAGREQ
jgi:hypothetical protein